MRVFLDVDIRGTHRLDIETFFEFFDIEFSEYNKRAFRLLAFGDGGQVRGLAGTERLTLDETFPIRFWCVVRSSVPRCFRHPSEEHANGDD